MSSRLPSQNRTAHEPTRAPRDGRAGDTERAPRRSRGYLGPAIVTAAFLGVGVLSSTGCSGDSDAYSYCDATGCYSCDGYGCSSASPGGSGTVGSPTPTGSATGSGGTDASAPPDRDAGSSPDANTSSDAGTDTGTNPVPDAGNQNCTTDDQCGGTTATPKKCLGGFCKYTCTTDDYCRTIDSRIGHCADDGVCRSPDEG